LSLVFGAIGYYIPRVELNRRVRHRQETILRALPSSIDLIAIAIEAGMGFDQALGYVRKRTRGPLSDEFGATLNEIRLGKSRVEALQHLANRFDIEDLKVFVGAVIESFQLGTSLAQTLRVQADSTRLLQRQRVQEEVMKVPVKILFPLVFFVFPVLLVVVLGPAAMNILNVWL